MDAIRTAAEWWANLLRKPADHDNGDELQSIFASVTFPCKTAMWVRPGKEVKVSAGYQAPIETIWKAE